MNEVQRDLIALFGLGMPGSPRYGGRTTMDFTLSRRAAGDRRAWPSRSSATACTLERLRELEAARTGSTARPWAELAKADLLGIALPEDVGGVGYGFLELCPDPRGAGPDGGPAPAAAHAGLGGAADRRVRHQGAARGAPRRRQWRDDPDVRLQRARRPRPTSRRRSPSSRATAGGSPARRSTCRRRTSRTRSSCRPGSARTSASSSSDPQADGRHARAPGAR